MRSLASFSCSLSSLSRTLPPRTAKLQAPCTRPSVFATSRRYITSNSEPPLVSEPSEHDLRYGYYEPVLPDDPPIWGTSHIIPRVVPQHIPKPPYVPDPSTPDVLWKEGPATTKHRLITDPADIEKLRKAARLAALTLWFASHWAKPGVTTDVIDLAVHEFVVKLGAYPSPLLYKGFPKSCCTSVNNIIVHGIPDDRPLQDGDIVNVDVTVYLDGFHGDTSKTLLVGDVDEKGKELVQITEAALHAGIAACGPGMPFKGIARAIHEVIRGKDYSVFPGAAGHGIGREFHRQPWIHHDLNEEPGTMQPGDCFTIEVCVFVCSTCR